MRTWNLRGLQQHAKEKIPRQRGLRHQAGTTAHPEMTKLRQYVIVRDNGETYVTCAETRDEALTEFHSHGFTDEWRILVRPKRKKAAKGAKP